MGIESEAGAVSDHREVAEPRTAGSLRVIAASELDDIRLEYERSLSWRVTRPLRALGRGVRAVRGGSEEVSPPGSGPGLYDTWLEHFHDDVLAPIDAACAAGGLDRFALFSELDVDLWALLLTQEYRAYPHIRALLPSMPDRELQERWNGVSGVSLATQSAAFYRRLRDRYAQAGERPLAEARVLDFGCGWGRLTRFLARDVSPGGLYGCDPVESILDVCRENSVPATFARSDFLPERLPFDEPFDLAFAFSVFTHLSEGAHERCLAALHAGLRPGAILVVTVRAPEYLQSCALMGPARDALGPDVAARLAGPRYVFAAHPVDASHPQYAGDEMTYGETVITLPYVRERWSRWFDLLHADLLIGDLHQVVLTLRRA
jgi:SAM-dependent methyltransferase